MKIETMTWALKMAMVGLAVVQDGKRTSELYRTRTEDGWAQAAARAYLGIARRYVRLQQENAMLRDEVAFWKAEALKDGDDA